MEDLEPIYYVYQHRRNDTGDVFYVGIGSTKKLKNYTTYYRANVTKRRTKFWKSVVEKAGGHSVDISHTCLTRKQACDKEIELIALYGRKDLGTGNLVNLTDGGDGRFGISVEVRAQISRQVKEFASRPGYKHPMKGKTWSVVARERYNERIRVRVLPDEVRVKFKTAIKGKGRSHSRLILNTETGIYYNGTVEAAFSLDMERHILCSMLRGAYKNRTSMVFCSETKVNYNKQSRLVFNTETGIFYESVSEAALAADISLTLMYHRLGGYKKNKTAFMYCSDESTLVARISQKRSNETRKKMSDSAKGKGPSVCTRLAVSKALKGRKHTDEQKLKSRLGKLAKGGFGKIILNKVTGIYYQGCKEAAESLGIKEQRMREQLCGAAKNRTFLIYC